jgi:hypothetical protein
MIAAAAVGVVNVAAKLFPSVLAPLLLSPFSSLRLAIIVCRFPYHMYCFLLFLLLPSFIWVLATKRRLMS